MQTAIQQQKESSKTTISINNTTANPLQLKQPANNPLQFTRKHALSYNPKVGNDLEAYYKNEGINNSSKLEFILINNYDLSEADPDYINLDEAKNMMPDYDDDALNDAYLTYLEWEEQQNKKKEKPTDQEIALPDKDKEFMGVLPTLKLGDRSITLIGTEHGANKPDYSGNVPKSSLENATLVLEYPSLTNTDRNQYSTNDIAGVNDNTQASLAKSTNGRKVIGGDGRKAFVDKQAFHSISIRHKEAKLVEITDKYMEDEEIQKLATNYVYAALELNKTNAEAVSIPIEKLVKYLDGTLPLLVLINTFNLVRQLSAELPPEDKVAIAKKVIQALKEDLIDLNDRYTSHQNETKKQLAIIQPEQKRMEEETRLGKATQLEFTENKISFLHDVVCNVLLFTEVIASDKNMVVAFGAHHIAPLKELIEDAAKPINSTS